MAILSLWSVRIDRATCQKEGDEIWWFASTGVSHGRPHIGANGVSWLAWKMDEKLKNVPSVLRAFSALMLLVGRQEGHPACKKTERWGAGVVICLEQGADLHIAQRISLPLTVCCFSKIQIGFTFLVPAHPGSPGQRAVKRMCVCVGVLHRNWYWHEYSANWCTFSLFFLEYRSSRVMFWV